MLHAHSQNRDSMLPAMAGISTFERTFFQGNPCPNFPKSAFFPTPFCPSLIRSASGTHFSHPFFPPEPTWNGRTHPGPQPGCYFSNPGLRAQFRQTGLKHYFWLIFPTRPALSTVPILDHSSSKPSLDPARISRITLDMIRLPHGTPRSEPGFGPDVCICVHPDAPFLTYFFHVSPPPWTRQPLPNTGPHSFSLPKVSQMMDRTHHGVNATHHWEVVHF